jgi:uncharacterized protein YkwD
MRYSNLMRFFLFVLLSLLAITIGVAFQVVKSQQGVPLNPQLLRHIADSRLARTDIIETLKQEIAAPPPLRSQLDQAAAPLSPAAILNETNQHRAAAGLPALTANATLNHAAGNKTADMFTQQYFEHVSPDGNGPAEVAKQAGYTFLRIGENLALGNFSSEADLVQSWMDSPGHRANILGKNFTEIGIAAQPGTFEGRPAWLAVQSFGLPATACPAPAQALRDRINRTQVLVEQQQAQLEPLADSIGKLAKEGNKKIAAGNEAIKKGNEAAASGSAQEAQALWDQGQALQQEGKTIIAEAEHKRNEYNSQAAELKDDDSGLNALIVQLNGQIKDYNNCLSGFSK